MQGFGGFRLFPVASATLSHRNCNKNPHPWWDGDQNSVVCLITPSSARRGKSCWKPRSLLYCGNKPRPVPAFRNSNPAT